MADRLNSGGPSGSRKKPRTVDRPPEEGSPSGYARLLEDIKSRIQTAQIRASLSVNRELILLYWQIGESIVERQRSEGWGKAIVERLALDLRSEFPGMKGLSPRNIWHMRSFYLAYANASQELKQAVSVSEQQEPQNQIECLGSAILPRPLSEIPWGHNIVLLQKIKDIQEKIWYAQQTIAQGWSRAMLVHWIESDLYARQGKAVSNFNTALPPPQSDLASEVVKDPYAFDFLTLRTDAAERELEQGLVNHIRKFLLELGTGFAFVGQQVHIEVDGEDFYLDLLFYHLHLRCFVVIELKAQPFKPEFVGKMNFYLSAVDDLLRHSDDEPSIGIILCKTRSKIVAEYALRDVAKPVGIARYVTRLVESLPDDLKGELPSVDSIEEELSAPP